MSASDPAPENGPSSASDADALAALRARLVAEVATTPSPARGSGVLGRALAVVLGFAALGTVVVAAGFHLEPRPPALIAATIAGALGLAALGTWLALSLGRSMLGRPTRVLAVALFALPVALFLWKVGWSAAWPDMDAWWPTRPGFRCLGLSLLGALGPVTAFVWLRRRAVPRHPGALGAALGMAAGASTWAILDLYCPVGNGAHLLLGHVLPMALVTAGGFFVGRRVFRPRGG